MKISWVSDIHLYLRKDPEWELARFYRLAHILNEDESEVVILGGDTFEVPRISLEETKAFYNFIDILKNKKVLVLSGNHENLTKDKTLFHYLPQVGFSYIENEIIQFRKATTKLHLVSHHRIGELNSTAVAQNTALLSHIRCTTGLFKSEINFDFAKNYSKTILGDIHSRTVLEHNVEYAGQPYSSTYDIAKVHGYFLLEVTPKGLLSTFKELTLPTKILLNTSFSRLKEILVGLNPVNKYKIRLNCTQQEVFKLPKVPNVIFQPVIDTGDVATEEIVEELKINGKIDIHNTILKLTEMSFELSDEVLRKGVSIMEGIKLGKA